jgi:S1-C subfamily serine protease
MNWLDISLLLLLLAALVVGARRGFWLTVLEYGGLLGGLLTGLWLAPPLLARTPIEATGLRFVVVALLLGGGIAVGGAALHRAGQALRADWHVAAPTRVIDRAGGALLTVAVTTVLVSSVLGAVAGGARSGPIAGPARDSALLRALDGITPAPSLLLRLREQVAGDLLPQLFAGREPDFPGALHPDPLNAVSEGVRRAAASTVKVQASGCGGLNLGSGAVVGPGRVVTNAHVISGTRSVAVIVPGNPRPQRADVVAFDAARDVAVLDVAGLTLPPLEAATPRHGMQAAILGYPQGGPLRVVPAAIQGEVRGEGPDIFGRRTVNRDVLVLNGAARPGNSGGPLVDTEGRLLGVVYAGSLSRPEQSYALALSEVLPALAAASAGGEPPNVGSQPCVS